LGKGISDLLLENGIQPVLTMYHWDTPQACEDQFGSWLSPKMLAAFTDYADSKTLVVYTSFG
jgi:beta-glucosidase